MKNVGRPDRSDWNSVTTLDLTTFVCFSSILPDNGHAGRSDRIRFDCNYCLKKKINNNSNNKYFKATRRRPCVTRVFTSMCRVMIKVRRTCLARIFSWKSFKFSLQFGLSGKLLFNTWAHIRRVLARQSCRRATAVAFRVPPPEPTLLFPPPSVNGSGGGGGGIVFSDAATAPLFFSQHSHAVRIVCVRVWSVTRVLTSLRVYGEYNRSTSFRDFFFYIFFFSFSYPFWSVRSFVVRFEKNPTVLCRIFPLPHLR